MVLEYLYLKIVENRNEKIFKYGIVIVALIVLLVLFHNIYCSFIIVVKYFCRLLFPENQTEEFKRDLASLSSREISILFDNYNVDSNTVIELRETSLDGKILSSISVYQDLIDLGLDILIPPKNLQDLFQKIIILKTQGVPLKIITSRKTKLTYNDGSNYDGECLGGEIKDGKKYNKFIYHNNFRNIRHVKY